MSTKKKIGILIAIAVILGVGKYVYDMHINHNFETITECKVYNSGVIPPDEIADYVKKYHIKRKCEHDSKSTREFHIYARICVHSRFYFRVHFVADLV